MPQAAGKVMQIPDVSGLKLGKAIELLKTHGIEKIAVRMTAPPRMRNESYDESSRTVREKVLEDGTLELLACNIDLKQGC